MSLESPDATEERAAKRRDRRAAPSRVTVAQHELQFGDQPIVLSGVPPRLSGPLWVRNPQSVAVRFKRLAIRTAATELGVAAGAVQASAAVPPTKPSKSKAAAASVAPQIDLDVQVVGKLRGGEAGELLAVLEVPLGTAPGSYQATLAGAGGAGHAVLVQVGEHRQVRLHPSSLARSATPGDKLSFQVSVRNLGNVTSLIPAATPVLLHGNDRDWMDHFHAAVKSSGDKGHAVFLDDFVARMAADEPPVGRAKIAVGAGPLAAQQGRMLEIEVTIPAKLPPDNDYLATLQLGDALLQLQLHCGAAPK